MSKIIDWLKIKAAARRLGIVDKGEIKSFLASDDDDNVHDARIVCANCRTFVRIFTRADAIGRWCWRCEVITSEDLKNPPMPAPEPEKKLFNKKDEEFLRDIGIKPS